MSQYDMLFGKIIQKKGGIFRGKKLNWYEGSTIPDVLDPAIQTLVGIPADSAGFEIDSFSGYKWNCNVAVDNVSTQGMSASIQHGKPEEIILMGIGSGSEHHLFEQTAKHFYGEESKLKTFESKQPKESDSAVAVAIYDIAETTGGLWFLEGHEDKAKGVITNLLGGFCRDEKAVWQRLHNFAYTISEYLRNFQWQADFKLCLSANSCATIFTTYPPRSMMLLADGKMQFSPDEEKRLFSQLADRNAVLDLYKLERGGFKRVQTF